MRKMLGKYEKIMLGEMLLAMAFISALMVGCTKEETKEVKPQLVTLHVAHVVEADEHTVHDIARKYIKLHKGPNGYARFVLTIKRANGLIDNPRPLRAGERLSVPVVVESTE